jgi:hypothetical protein
LKGKYFFNQVEEEGAQEDKKGCCMFGEWCGQSSPGLERVLKVV